MEKIKLNLVPSLIIEAVKGETFIKGNLDRAIDEKATGVAYQEIAGDETTHERKLKRTMYAALEELKGFLSDYIDNGSNTSGDNVASEIDSENDTIVIELSVSSRFNKSYTISLARLCSSFIENKMLMLWWTAINASQAGLYATLCQSDVLSIKRCFIKTAPSVPTLKYTSRIGVEGTEIELDVDDTETLTYTTDKDVIDDVECFCNNDHVRVSRCSEGFVLTGISDGVSVLTLFSRHNTDVQTKVEVKVVKDVLQQ